MTTTEARATYRRFSQTRWEGVVKDTAGSVLAACGHAHNNRAQSSIFNGQSAVSCARDLIAAMGLREQDRSPRARVLTAEADVVSDEGMDWDSFGV